MFPFDETISVGDVLAVLAAPAGSRGEAARFDVSPLTCIYTAAAANNVIISRLVVVFYSEAGP